MIYVVSNGNKETGGPETLHQIAYTFIHNHYEAAMVYYNPRSYKTPERYKKYNVPVASKIIDSRENVLIVPEALTHILSRYKKIQKCIAWLSVDYYMLSEPNTLIRWRMKENGWPTILYPLAFIVLLAKGKIQFRRYQFNDKGGVIHTYNCEYARRFLIDRGINPYQTIYICGPLNDVFFKETKTVSTNNKENYILYNPTKGTVFTQKVIAYCNNRKIDAKFVPLKNMTADEVAGWMKRAKVYIDFGEFPGPERIPREAVMMGCNILTSKNGGAGNEIDVPIPDFLKFDDKEENLENIYEMLTKLLSSYEEYYKCYDRYREKVENQPNDLNKNIVKLAQMLGTISNGEEDIIVVNDK